MPEINISTNPIPKYPLGTQVRVDGVSQPIPPNGQMSITFSPGCATFRIHEGHVIIRETREAPVRGILHKWSDNDIQKSFCYSNWQEGCTPDIQALPTGTYYWIGLVNTWIPEAQVTPI